MAPKIAAPANCNIHSPRIKHPFYLIMHGPPDSLLIPEAMTHLCKIQGISAHIYGFSTGVLIRSVMTVNYILSCFFIYHHSAKLR